MTRKFGDLSSPLSKKDLEGFRPARETLPAEVMEAFRNKGGRPRAENPKLPVSIRLDQDLLQALEATGDGWRTRVNDELRKLYLQKRRPGARPVKVA